MSRASGVSNLHINIWMDLQHNLGTYMTTKNSLHFINLLSDNKRNHV